MGWWVETSGLMRLSTLCSTQLSDGRIMENEIEIFNVLVAVPFALAVLISLAKYTNGALAKMGRSTIRCGLPDGASGKPT